MNYRILLRFCWTEVFSLGLAIIPIDILYSVKPEKARQNKVPYWPADETGITLEYFNILICI
ncbi:MAG: hypothetical protein L3J24_07905 [Xanthomonadales bacterium]|nr:hypothetical protein [Xanthomonadales bacterium]